jgi:HAD superfamily hydrolase (TIGR01490 family)
MSKKFAVFDIDGTLFRWQLFHELVFALKDQQLFDADASIALDKAFIDWRGLKSSWSDYESQVVGAIETQISHIEPAELERTARQVVAKSGHKVYAYTANLVKDLKEKGYFLLAISGSQQEIAELFAHKHGFDACIGMVHERDANGKYTGKYERFVVDRKANIAKEYVQNHGLTYADSFAVGDSAGDIGMLELVENPIAFNPSQELFDAATANNWPIVIERKNIAYRLEKGNDGYSLAETRHF